MELTIAQEQLDLLLKHVIYKNDREAIKLLVQLGADINKQPPEEDSTYLEIALKSGDSNLAYIILKNGGKL